MANKNILILGNYNSSTNVYLSELETFLGLKRLGYNIHIVGKATDEIHNFFNTHQIPYYPIAPEKKFDKKFTKTIQNLIVQNQINILYIRNGKFLRSFLPFFRKKDIKIITYYGSTSLHWYDPFAYLSYLNPKVDKIIGNSQFVFQHLKKQLINKKKAFKIYKGYSIQWFEKTQPFDYTKLNIPSQSIKVILVGRNDKVKDIPTFLKAAQHLQKQKNIHFILVGKGLTIENFSSYQKNEKIHFLGFRKDAPELIKGADIYVQTSKSEGLGRAISEAAAMGKPVIMTNAGGCTELINPDKSGFIVPVGDDKALADKILFLSQDQKLRHLMGKNAIQKMKTDLSVEQTITQFHHLFQSL